MEVHGLKPFLFLLPVVVCIHAYVTIGSIYEGLMEDYYHFLLNVDTLV